MTAPHPYENLEDRAYWRSGVAVPGIAGLSALYRPKFPIKPRHRIVTAGSCFAQHIARSLAERGFGFRDYEPAPALLPEDQRAAFGYGVYSARYGNLYTARQLLQTFDRAFGRAAPQDQAWERATGQSGRCIDPYRPTIEPGGFASRAEMEAARDSHFEAVRRVFTECDVFVFTLGLTEAWQNADDGFVYPVCPGVAGGVFDPKRHIFRNFAYPEVLADMEGFLARLAEVNPKARVLLTVSPVPLTATAAGDHVLAATTYSKAVLRAVAGDLAAAHEGVDYFPSFEIVTTWANHGRFFETNFRSVTTEGVDTVMGHFFAAHGDGELRAPPAAAAPVLDSAAEDDLICDDLLLDRA